MMEDLAMHILELVMNSIHAKAKVIKLFIEDSLLNNTIKFIIEDDGKGMGEEKVKNITSPFATDRTTRKVGMGLAFLQGLCDMCDGSLKIESKKGFGTKIEALIRKDHIDVPERGDIGFVIMSGIQADSDIRFIFTYKTDESEFVFDSEEIKNTLEDVRIDNPMVLMWITDYINQNLGG